MRESIWGKNPGRKYSRARKRVRFLFKRRQTSVALSQGFIETEKLS